MSKYQMLTVALSLASPVLFSMADAEEMRSLPPAEVLSKLNLDHAGLDAVKTAATNGNPVVSVFSCDGTCRRIHAGIPGSIPGKLV